MDEDIEEQVIDTTGMHKGLTGGMFSELLGNGPREGETVVNDDISFTDEDWVSDTFMVPSNSMDDDYNFLRFNSTVDVKFSDTTMGGSISINCSPQYTRYADVRSTGLYNARPKVKVGLMSTDNGLGRYYSEAIDDNSTNVFFEFGVPAFNNILSYLMGAVDYRTAVIANSARSPFFYEAGWLFGAGALIIAFPIITPILLVAKFATKLAATLISSNGRFDQYYLKRTMFMYWSSVNSIVTMMANELGLIAPIFDSTDTSKIGAPQKLDAGDLAAINEIMPGLITKNGAVNVHAMVAKSQKMFNKMQAKKIETLDALANGPMSKEDFEKFIQITSALDHLDKVDQEDVNDLWDELTPKIKADKQFAKEKKGEKTSFSKLIEKLKDDGGDLRESLSLNKDGTMDRKTRKEDEPGFVKKAYETAKTVFNEGARYSVFRVEHLRSSTESFSNSVEEMAATNTVNSMGQTWRNMKFNFGIDGIPGVGSAVNAITDFAIGGASGITMRVSDVIGSILSGANVEVQKKWTKSSVSFPTQSFKMSLISPSAHPVAQLRNIYIPLAAIMAGMLPLSTGPRSSTSPYLCSMFIRGRQQINLGMITSLTITRGTSNLPFNKSKRPLAIDVTFSVTDFSELISAPTPTGLLNMSSVMYDDESGLSRYIQALCGRDLYSSTHAMGKARIKMSKFYQSADAMLTPEYFGARIGDTADVGGVFSLFGGSKAMTGSDLF